MTFNPEIHVLDHGMIRLVDSMGTDLSIVRAARVSYDAAWRAGEDEGSDSRLLRRLWSGGKPSLGLLPAHSTPFEAVNVTFEVRAPIFVFRQWHRHRTQSYNELSARYRELPETFYLPEAEAIGIQSKSNKQGRTIEVEDESHLDRRREEVEWLRIQNEQAFALYHRLLENNWPKELARTCLPLGTYSHMFTTGNLLNFFRFLALRLDPHAQYEVRVYAEAMLGLLETFVPGSVALFNEARRGSGQET